MALLFRRLLVSVLVPYLWKRWRNRGATPVDSRATPRPLGRAEPGAIAAGPS